DAPGEYSLPHVTLTKTVGPALSPKELGPVDAVLLSHDQHADNLDHAGRAYLSEVPRVFTTKVAAHRLGGPAPRLAPGGRGDVGGGVRGVGGGGRPGGIEALSGDVVGFVLGVDNHASVYVTGDTVWYDGIAEVARRFPAKVVLLFAGAAQTRGPFNLTM